MAARKPAAPRPARHVALLRGINVGKAKRIAMADLRRVVAELGFGHVETLLNSGNVLFAAPDNAGGGAGAAAARRIEEAVASRLAVRSRVTVLAPAELAEAIADNPLLRLMDNPSRLLVSVFSEPGAASRLAALAARDWAPDAMAIGRRAAYLWCGQGILQTSLGELAMRALGEAATSRNWATMTKLHALAAPDASAAPP